MEWIAHCTVCGELDRAPNGAMMESLARIHRRDTGHMTIVGHEPSIIMSGEMVEVRVGEERKAHSEYRGFILEEVHGVGIEGVLVYVSRSTWLARDAIRGESSIEAAKAWIDTQVGEEHPVDPARTFPKTYGDWANLTADIKDRYPDDPVMWATANTALAEIFAEEQRSEGWSSESAAEGRRWLTMKAGELGIR